MIETGVFGLIVVLSIWFIYANIRYNKDKDILHN